MWLFVLVIFLTPGITAGFYSSNVTDFLKCKVHYSRSEDSYKEFFQISDELRENDTLLDFHFSVLAPSDAHILLTPSIKLNKSDPAYEVVLGAGGNKFSDIRRAQKSAVKASVRIKGLLSALDVHSFWLHVFKDGVIEVGREGEELAFINWKDPDPIPIKYFSFGTWVGVEAKWYFDCPRNDNTSSNSKEVLPELTNLQRLKKDLLTYYDPYVRPVLQPQDVTIVQMNLNIYYLSLNEHESSMSIKGAMELKWNDEKMKWNPDIYGNITNVYVFGRQIWQPDLLLLNSVDLIGRDILSQSIMIVGHDGTVQWRPQTQMKVWCDATKLGHWPNDAHSCHVFLSFAADTRHLQLQFDDANSNILREQFQTEWDVLKVTAVSDFVGNYTDDKTAHLDRFDSSFLKIFFDIKRNSNVYNSVFFAPFLAIAVSAMSTFFVSPFGYLKVGLNCFQLVVTTFTLVSLASFLPAHPAKVPYLVQLYEFSFYGNVACLLISVLVINLSRAEYKQPVPVCIWKILSNYLLQKLFLVPSINIPEEYGKLNEFSEAGQNNESVQYTWILVGKAIDRIACIVYFILIVYALCSRY